MQVTMDNSQRSGGPGGRLVDNPVLLASNARFTDRIRRSGGGDLDAINNIGGNDVFE